jgi:hypothetical protein
MLSPHNIVYLHRKRRSRKKTTAINSLNLKKRRKVVILDGYHLGTRRVSLEFTF